MRAPSLLVLAALTCSGCGAAGEPGSPAVADAPLQGPALEELIRRAVTSYTGGPERKVEPTNPDDAVDAVWEFVPPRAYRDVQAGR